jgi:ribosome-associated heat shock protein Hsp15
MGILTPGASARPFHVFDNEGMPTPQPAPRTRLDKWLWAARLYKTRGLAVEQIDRGRVTLNGASAKPAREVHLGDTVSLRRDGGVVQELVVLALSTVRGPAAQARALYQETPASQARREQADEARRVAPDPGAGIAQGRPTKRDRRQLDSAAGGWHRWSASIDDS